MFRRKARTNRWKGFVLGSLGGVAGILAMQYYWQMATWLHGGQDPRKMKAANDSTQALDSISLVGQQHKEGESSTAALGRIAYRALTGKEPRSQETRTMLSYLTHWIISMSVAGLYGALRGRTTVPGGGAAMGTTLWLLGDELAMPLLGLAEGPTAYSPLLHIHSFGAHLSYGVASSLAAQALHRLT